MLSLHATRSPITTISPPPPLLPSTLSLPPLSSYRTAQHDSLVVAEQHYVESVALQGKTSTFCIQNPTRCVCLSMCFATIILPWLTCLRALQRTVKLSLSFRSQVHNHKLYSVNLQLLLQATAQVEANVDVALRLLSPPLPRVSSPTLSRGVVTKLFASDTRFSTDDGATVLMAFRGIQADFPTRQCLQINRTGASTPRCGPFEGWTGGYHVRHIDDHTSSCPLTHGLL